MKICLKNIKYLFFNPEINNFSYYKGNCYIENGLIIGYGNEENNFDQVIDMTGKLLMPMLCNMNCNLEDNIYYRLQNNWDTTKFSSLENTMGQILKNTNENYYEDIAPSALRNVINQGTGLVCTRRCYKTLSYSPIFGLCSYPISRAQYLRNYIDNNLITSIIDSNNSPNIIHGFNIRNLYDNDDGSLSLVKNNLHKAKFISTTIGLSELSQNLVKQKWLKDELAVLNMYDLLHSNTLLFGCNTLNELDLKRIKDVNATIVYMPLMSQTLKTPLGNPLMAEKEGINWCIASGSPSSCDSINMFYVMQETAKIFPALSKNYILKAVTINPQIAMRNIIGTDLLSQANFTIVTAPYEFDNADNVISYLFTANYNELNSQVMICGNITNYNNQDNMENYKNVLRSYYKRYDEFLINPNMFVNEVPQKP